MRETVERALFQWEKWRFSLIRQWMRNDTYSQFSPDELNVLAKSETATLGFENIGFAFYWTCCLTSDVNFDYEKSFETIRVPTWWTPEFNRAFSVYGLQGKRMFPPKLVNDRDRRFFPLSWSVDVDHFLDGRGYVFLKPAHQLYTVLNELKGRPRKRGRAGRRPGFPDRLAVRCASLRKLRNSVLQISKLVDLPEEVLFEGKQPDVVRHLINRGNRLIGEYESQ